MTAPKPPLLFAAGRSGSTVFYEILKSYLNQKYGVQGLSEYFDPHVNSALDLQRIRSLKGDPGRWFFKVLSPQLIAGTEWTWLRDSYEWIFVKRRNLFEQYLSLLVSIETGVWCAEQGVKIGENPIFVSPETFQGALDRMWGWFVFKARIKPSRYLVYEDFLAHRDPVRVIDSLGWPTDGFDPGLVRLPLPQNNNNKLACFSDRGKVLSAYRNSFLHSLCPLDRELET